MDTSETYIKMCDCEEIQALQSWGSDGDDVFVIASDFATGTSNVGIIPNYAKHSYNMWYTDALLKKHVWLPRQDQLQEMVNIKPLDTYWVQWLRFLVTKDWIIQEYPLRFRESMEQLWLAFVMKEKHGKVWNGKEFIKS